MGPGEGFDSLRSLPSRPRFWRDLKDPPWTDGNRDQLKNVQAVELSARYKDKMADSNQNNAVKEARGLVASLFGRSLENGVDIRANIIDSEDAVPMITKSI